MLIEMTKVKFDPSLTVYPMPVCLVGANVKGRPNFMAVAWFSKVNYSPPMMMVALGKRQYTAEGVRENGAFSINLPGEGLVAETDHCGTVSGRDEDKSRLFDIFYGEMGEAPMIRECPVCFELELVETVELPRTLLFIGRIVNAYADEEHVSDGRVDIPGTQQFTLIESPSSLYLSLGGQMAEAYSVGKSLSK
jgi:flavin reductase (DIM6/NTAB) family NADH-FMN oxidoreductase RutF